MFDLSLPKLLVLAVIALVIFGPNELPTIAAQVGRALRDLRKIAESAKNDLREELGPEFAGLEIENLNPERFVQKHLFGDPNADQGAQQQPAANSVQGRAPFAIAGTGAYSGRSGTPVALVAGDATASPWILGHVPAGACASACS